MTFLNQRAADDDVSRMKCDTNMRIKHYNNIANGSQQVYVSVYFG